MLRDNLAAGFGTYNEDRMLWLIPDITIMSRSHARIAINPGLLAKLQAP